MGMTSTSSAPLLPPICSAGRDSTDSLGRRNRLYPRSSGKRLRLTARDLRWLQALREHGPLPTSFLIAYASSSHLSDKRAKERLCDLFNEEDTPHDGAYLTRPLQQFRTIDSRYNQLVHDLAPAGRKALQDDADCGVYVAPSGPWLHRALTTAITASIELACLTRTDVTFIPQSRILARAGTTLCYPVKYVDPASKRLLARQLIPDAVFGLQYHTLAGDRFRFFAVEADRATEPLTSANGNRKSVERTVCQYHTYVAEGAYRNHLKLTAPMLVLNILTCEVRKQRMIDRIAARYPRGCAFMLFQTWSAFGGIFRPPHPKPEFLMAAWERAGMAPLPVAHP